MHIDIVIFKKESKGFNPNQNSFGCVLQKLQSYNLLAQTADDACRSLAAGK